MFFSRVLEALPKTVFANEAVTIAASRIVCELLREFKILSTEAMWKHASQRGLPSLERLEVTIKWMASNKQIHSMPASSMGFPGLSEVHVLPDSPFKDWKGEETPDEKRYFKYRRRCMARRKNPIPRIFWDL